MQISKRIFGSCVQIGGIDKTWGKAGDSNHERCYRKFDRSEILSLRSYFLGNFIAERYFFLGNIIAARKFDRSRCHGS